MTDQEVDKPDFTRDSQGNSDTEDFITTQNGDRVAIPAKLTWGQELRAFKAIGNLIRNIPGLKDINWAERAAKAREEGGEGVIKISDLLNVLPDLLSQGECLTSFAAAVLKKDEKWVEDNLDVKEVLRVVGPFFTRCLGKMADSVPAPPLPPSDTQQQAGTSNQ